jgi:hypothetical protein
MPADAVRPPDALAAATDGDHRCHETGHRLTWIFLNAHGDGPRERCRFRAWWLRAEGFAELEHDERWGWHSLRRSATEV